MSKSNLEKIAKSLGIKIAGLEDMPELEMTPSMAQPKPGGPIEVVENAFWTRAIHPGGETNYLKTVSDKYHLEQHHNLLTRILEELGELPEFGIPGLKLDFNPTGGCMWADFKFPDAINVGTKKHEDPLFPRIIVVNSADTKKRLGLSYGAWRLICSNGMMIPDERFPDSKKIQNLHKRGAIDIEEIVSGFKLGFQNFSEALGIWKNYAQLEISADTFANALEVIGLSEKMGEKIMDTTMRGQAFAIGDKLKGGGANGWDAYNSITQFVTDETENHSTAIDRTRKAGEFFDGLLKAA